MVISKVPGKAEAGDRACFPIVGMGASAGGLEAFQQFFQAMPTDSGLAFVLVQHLDPEHGSVLKETAAALHRHAGGRGESTRWRSRRTMST